MHCTTEHGTAALAMKHHPFHLCVTKGATFLAAGPLPAAGVPVLQQRRLGPGRRICGPGRRGVGLGRRPGGGFGRRGRRRRAGLLPGTPLRRAGGGEVALNPDSGGGGPTMTTTVTGILGTPPGTGERGGRVSSRVDLAQRDRGGWQRGSIPTEGRRL